MEATLRSAPRSSIRTRAHIIDTFFAALIRIIIWVTAAVFFCLFGISFAEKVLQVNMLEGVLFVPSLDNPFVAAGLFLWTSVGALCALQLAVKPEGQDSFAWSLTFLSALAGALYAASKFTQHFL